MNKNTLNNILQQHKVWLWDESEGVRANLRGANLFEVDLYGADLRGANLRGANLREADLREADLREADLREADLRGADLRGANLYGASLCKADLLGAKLLGTELHGTDLRGAKNVPYIPMACPDTGEFIAWKKAYDKEYNPYLVKLFIPEDARRSSGIGRKCRADKAVVLSIEPIVDGSTIPEVVYSKYDESFTYKVGQTVVVPNFNTDRFNECSFGIHFFICKQEAINYSF